jgi:ABC-type transport system involved in multi-copper enzyme maturation permease subunit
MLIVQTAAGFINYSNNPELGTGYQVAASSLQISVQMLVLIILAISCISISEEISSGTVKLILVRGVRRCDFVLGKYLTLMYIGIVLVILMNVLGLGLGHVFGGLGPLKEGEFLLHSSMELAKDFAKCMLLTIPPMITLIAFGVFVSILIKGSGGAVGVGVVSYFFLQILSQLNPIQKYIFTNYLSLPVDKLAKIVDGTYMDLLRDMYWNFGVSIISIVIFVCLSIIIFNKKDLWN